VSDAAQMRIDGEAVAVRAGATILDACDAAGHYVPRLCYYPGLGCAGCGAGRAAGAAAAPVCGLCAVQLGDGCTAPACSTRAAAGLEVTTDSPQLRALRLERLGPILASHPHVCLACPDAEGCSRDQCTYGNPPEARCCAEFGRCELGRLVAWMDPALALPRRAVIVQRDSTMEGRIRWEAGLCVGCGRCVRACATLSKAGDALEMVDRGGGAGAAIVARPKNGGLRASGCTFCGQCVIVCPAGALTAPGAKGAEWLAGRRERSDLREQALPPRSRQPFERQTVETSPAEAGVFRLLDGDGCTLLVRGVPDLRRGLCEALADPDCSAASFFELELDELYTQRESELLAAYAQEHGGLPCANDLDDDLF
jgi:predicted molibdopterin-dependent oxidoreductase YjgC